MSKLRTRCTRCIANALRKFNASLIARRAGPGTPAQTSCIVMIVPLGACHATVLHVQPILHGECACCCLNVECLLTVTLTACNDGAVQQYSLHLSETPRLPKLDNAVKHHAVNRTVLLLSTACTA
jgi:hypothetical protein